jgi:hypothetical protein
MKKLCFVLTALLLAVPAAYAADVTISCTDDGDEVTVSYTASADANKPRAFGLNIELNNGETITSLTLLDPNYWVYPGTIDINESGVIENDGNGIGQQDDAAYPDTLYGLDSNGITIEIGSLHSPPEYDSPNAPDLSSDILKFTVSGDCNVAISGNAARGNVVLYDTTAADVDYGSGCTVTIGAASCRDQFTTTEQALFDRYSANGKDPNSWCWQYQCYGDATNDEETIFATGTFRVYQQDLGLLISSWQDTPETGADPRADFTHSEETIFLSGTFSVYQQDLSILINRWGDTTAEMPGDCPTYIAP